MLCSHSRSLAGQTGQGRSGWFITSGFNKSPKIRESVLFHALMEEIILFYICRKLKPCLEVCLPVGAQS